MTREIVCDKEPTTTKGERERKEPTTEKKEQDKQQMKDEQAKKLQ